MNSDGMTGYFHYRTADLSAYAGKTLTSIAVISETTSGAGTWLLKFADFVLISTDGTVQPVYTNETTATLSQFGSSGVTGVSGGVDHVSNSSDPTNTTWYYHGDQIGSSRLMSANEGWPVWQGTFLPYGEEYNPQITTNHYKFTGKERDSETGLDYFGARYYGNALGRWMTTDPLLNSGRPDDPQSWNRYVFVHNNPLRNIDPTGLYDLNNTCGANDAKCNKEFQQHAKDLKNGLKNLQDKLKDVKDPMQKARLEAALKALGTEGDHNGVGVSFGKTQGGGSGETLPVYDQKTGNETYQVTFDPKMLKSEEDYAVAGAHEGTHIDDISSYLANPNGLSPLSNFSLEYRGYQTSAFAAAALGASSLSQNYDGKSYLIWNGSWGQVDKNITNFVTRFHDKQGNLDHPETQPHNPWPK